MKTIRFTTNLYQVNFASAIKMFCILDRQDGYRCVAAFDSLKEAKGWIASRA